MDNQLWGVAFNRYCRLFRAEYVNKISSHFQSRHGRIIRSSSILNTTSNDSDYAICPFRGIVAQFWQYFFKLFQADHMKTIIIINYSICQINSDLLKLFIPDRLYDKLPNIENQKCENFGNKQYQCKLMKKGNEKQSILPIINSAKNHQKPIRDILKDLKQRKMVIESRIKTQIQQSDPEDKSESQNQHLRQRVVTEVPYYMNRRGYYRRHNGADSLDQLNYQRKINEESDYQESGRASNMKTQIRKRSSFLQPIDDTEKKVQLSPKNKRQRLREIEELCVEVPVDPKARTEENISQLKQYLIENNIFFGKIHNVIATCILKLNRLMWIEKNQVLYRKGEQRNSFYIVLYGRIKITDQDKNLKKICHPGQSIGQQLLFSNKIRKVVKQTSKAVSRCFLVQLKVQNYKKITEEMTRYGYRVIFNEMQSILKRNYITKNWLRGQKQRFEKKH